VFTTEAATAASWSPGALAHAVRRGQLIRLARGVYVPAERWEGTGTDAARRRATIRAVAATHAVTGSRASHTSAALLADLPVWDLPDRPCLTVRPRFTGDSRCAHLHRATLDRAHLVGTAGVPRTSIARTVLDIAREHGVDDAVVVGDAALHEGMVVVEQLVRVAEFCAGWPGSRRALAVLELLDDRSESPLESVSRIRLAGVGVPAPEPQVDIFDAHGLFLGRLDFYWDEFGVAGEVDGKAKYGESPVETVWREKRRQGRMEDTGLIFVRWGRPDLEAMNRLAARLRTGFARGARRPRSDREWVVRYTPRFAPRMRAISAG
jgi:Transcriptional regulator, AbiEi antitoxin